jgi:membrane carboxypeptidase/penicillin-binding protein
MEKLKANINRRKMNNLIKQLLKENLILEAAKQGSGEELIELLEFLPVDDTAKYLTEEIYQDIVKYYINDISPKTKDYTTHKINVLNHILFKLILDHQITWLELDAQEDYIK